MATVSLADFRADHFADQIGCPYRVLLPEHRETLTLTEVEAGRKSPSSQWRDPFLLIFKGENAAVMIAQGIVPLECEKFGRLDLGMAPLSRNADGTFLYQVCFC